MPATCHAIRPPSSGSSTSSRRACPATTRAAPASRSTTRRQRRSPGPDAFPTPQGAHRQGPTALCFAPSAFGPAAHSHRAGPPRPVDRGSRPSSSNSRSVHRGRTGPGRHVRDADDARAGHARGVGAPPVHRQSVSLRRLRRPDGAFSLEAEVPREPRRGRERWRAMTWAAVLGVARGHAAPLRRTARRATPAVAGERPSDSGLIARPRSSC